MTGLVTRQTVNSVYIAKKVFGGAEGHIVLSSSAEGVESK